MAGYDDQCSTCSPFEDGVTSHSSSSRRQELSRIRVLEDSARDEESEKGDVIRLEACEAVLR